MTTMIAATRRSRPSPFQKFSSSSSSSAVGDRPRATGRVAKDGSPYNPHAGGPLEIERRDGVAHGIGDVVHGHRRGVTLEIIEPVEPRTELARRDPFVNVPVNHQRRSSPQEDRFERLRSQLRPPFFFLAAHRHVRRRIVGQEDLRAVSRQEAVEDLDPTLVLFRSSRQVLPLPPRRAVQTPDAPDDSNASRRRLEDRGLVLEEPDAECVGESGDVRGMVAGVLVVPDNSPTRGRHASPYLPPASADTYVVVTT